MVWFYGHVFTVWNGPCEMEVCNRYGPSDS